MAERKISELESTTDLQDLYTIGTDKNNNSKKVKLQFLKEAADYANAQGDYAKEVADNTAGNTGVNDYPIFSASGNYVAGDVVNYNGRLYRFTAPHQSGSWNGNDVVSTSINAESQRKLTELSEETSAILERTISFSKKGVNLLSTPLLRGTLITGVFGTDVFTIRWKNTQDYGYLKLNNLPVVVSEDIDVIYSNEDVEGWLRVGEPINSRVADIDSNIIDFQMLKGGTILSFGGVAANVSLTPFVLRKGMVVSNIELSAGVLQARKHNTSTWVTLPVNTPFELDADYSALRVVSSDAVGTMELSSSYDNILAKASQINELSTRIDATEEKVAGGMFALKGGEDYSYIDGEWFSFGTIEYLSAKWHSSPIFLSKGETIYMKRQYLGNGVALVEVDKDNNWIRDLVYTDGVLEHSYTAEYDIYVSVNYLKAYEDVPRELDVEVNRIGIQQRITDLEKGGNSGLSDNPYIAMPIPQLAMVNVVASSLPTTKTDDIHASLEFNDMQGNVFVKKIIINAQGNSSLGLAKKNFSIDIVDENYEDSHEIKFGDWVAQDGFHLKAYMLDGIRVKPLAVYDFYESILLTRGVSKDRVWKRLQLPSDISATSNSIEDSYMQLDNGAKNHPSGFPVILNFNEEFYGIYCWQLKKHRDNYHQKKSKAEHIHLDGNISNDLLWRVNGVIDWDKWAGKKQESELGTNKDGIEVRNPKKLILTDGTEYDADTNTGELISANSAKYDSSNADMVRTAAVRASIESLSRRVYALTQMTKSAEKKAAIADVFEVDSIIDYIIFGQITGNEDGYKKNWQWVTYDGVKWAVNAYDVDWSWGYSGTEFFQPASSWLGTFTPPIALIIENYPEEIKARYKELRDKGVISLEKIMHPLVNYVKIIGLDYYDMEFEKWTRGGRDNLWRFESWMEESIKRTDALMGYNS